MIVPITRPCCLPLATMTASAVAAKATNLPKFRTSTATLLGIDLTHFFAVVLHRHFQNTASVLCTSVETRLLSPSRLFFPSTLKKIPQFSLGRHSRKSVTLCRLFLVPSFNLYKYSVPHLFLYCYSSPLLPFNCSALPGHGSRMVKEQQSRTRQEKNDLKTNSPCLLQPHITSRYLLITGGQFGGRLKVVIYSFRCFW